MAQAAWQPNPNEFREAWDAAQSITDLASRLRITPNTLYRYCRETGIDLTPKRSNGGCGPRLPVSVPAPSGTDEMDQISDEDLTALCESRGITVLRSPLREDREHVIGTPTFDGQGTFRVGVVSDTHCGSRYQQMTFLHAAYDEFERQGITDVIHGGDWSAGAVSMHPGMVYEQFVQGADQQTEYICERYPLRSGITTYGISGNHDHSFLKAGGINVVRNLARDRADIRYLGMSGAYLTINGIRFYIHHPSGGMAYARSYRLQKTIEQFSPQNKPKVLICGHLHTTNVLESYRNVYGFLAGCFEAQTPYEVERGLDPEIGFSTLEITYDDEGAVRFRKEWVPLYVPIEGDY